MGAGPRFSGFGLGVLLAAIAVGSAPSSLAEIRATGKNGLKTEVNGLRGGRCNQGVCRIGGGTNAGKNKFHRFKELATSLIQAPGDTAFGNTSPNSLKLATSTWWLT